MVTFRGDPDALHRAVKMALDSGEAATHDEALAMFRGYRLAVAVGPDATHSATLQAAVLTAVNTARRCFLGGVSVIGALDVPLQVPWRACRTLREAVVDLGGIVDECADENGSVRSNASTTTARTDEIPLVVIGDADGTAGRRPFAVRATFDGWAGGVVPLASGRRLAERQECTPAGVLAGAIAIAEAFQHVRGGNAAAGRRDVGLSLWRPEPDVSWLAREAVGPPLRLLPTKLWLIGLGHLGQAFLWTLGFLPYDDPAALELVLQDFDTLVEANDSTSPLTWQAMRGQKKTRAMAAWAEARGFRTVITERRFAADFHVTPDEPAIALCGVDNPQARAAVEDVGFARVIEAGLGKGVTEYLAFQLHTFPGPQRARDVWHAARAAAAAPTAPTDAGPSRPPAYAALAAAGLDECGLTLLAGRSVGAAFVGAAVSALVVAEVLRSLERGPAYGLIDGSLRALSHRSVLAHEPMPDGWNPGFCRAAVGSTERATP